MPATATSLPRHVTGSVTPVTATVRALQAFTGGPTVEVASPSVDAGSGAFELDVAVDAPQKTSFVPNPASIAFTADPAVAGLYTLEATSAGAKKSMNINATAPVPAVVLSFP